jgi:hypothetical protein
MQTGTVSNNLAPPFWSINWYSACKKELSSYSLFLIISYIMVVKRYILMYVDWMPLFTMLYSL